MYIWYICCVCFCVQYISVCLYMSFSAYMCAWLFIYMSVCVCMFTYMFLCKSACTSVNIHVWVSVYMCMIMYECMLSCSCVRECMFRYVFRYSCICVCIYECVCGISMVKCTRWNVRYHIPHIIPRRCSPRPIWLRQYLSWCYILAGDSSFYQVDREN